MQIDAGCQVEDDVLPRESFLVLWQNLQKLRYERPSGQWHKLNQISDPPTMASGSFKWSEWPFGHGLDEICKDIVDRIRSCSLYGEEGVDWNNVGFRVYLHARGSRLSIHADDKIYKGACVYYAHPEWRFGWGGELMLPTMPDKIERDTDPLDGPISLSCTRKHAMISGFGAYISPKPNRLVLIKGGSWHATNRVDIDAGESLRCSISGFIYFDEDKARGTEARSINI